MANSTPRPWNWSSRGWASQCRRRERRAAERAAAQQAAEEEMKKKKEEEARQKAEEEEKKQAAILEQARLARLHDQVMNEPRPWKARRIWWPSPWHPYASAPWRYRPTATQHAGTLDDHVSEITAESDTESESLPRWK